MVGSLVGASELLSTVVSPISDIEAEGKGLAIMTSKQTNTQANRKQAGKKRQIEKEREDRERERANKTTRVKWGRGTREANGK